MRVKESVKVGACRGGGRAAWSSFAGTSAKGRVMHPRNGWLLGMGRCAWVSPGSAGRLERLWEHKAPAWVPLSITGLSGGSDACLRGARSLLGRLWGKDVASTPRGPGWPFQVPVSSGRCWGSQRGVAAGVFARRCTPSLALKGVQGERDPLFTAPRVYLGLGTALAGCGPAVAVWDGGRGCASALKSCGLLLVP